MTAIEIWVHTPAAKALGWTLFHFLWEGAVVALALAVALWVARSARVRYAAACVALVAMLAGFVFTFGRLVVQQQAQTATVRPLGPPLGLRDPGPDGGARLSPRFTAADLLPWFAPLWMAGVLVFHVRALAGWMGVRRLRRTGVCGPPGGWQGRLDVLASRLRVSRPVTLLESCLTDVPLAIGYLRPVILMPLGLVAGMPAGAIEAILIHELAHIRRHDYLLNLVQTFAESLLFYHPAVWWISGVMRAERENCCDDWVLAVHGDAREYATALASLEHNRDAAHSAATAATGGNIVKRIRRLLYQTEKPHAVLTPVFSAGILTVTAAVALVAWQAPPQQPQSKQPSTVRGPRLETPYQKWIAEDVAYIITDEERAAFKGLPSDEEREHFIEQFWLRRDPTPGTPSNEFKEEHYRRIAYVNEHYASGIPGWKTDRGRIYINYGPADEIESHPSGGQYQRPPKEGGGTTSTFPFEQWLYRHIDGIGYNVIIEFVDRTGSGDFRMTTDPREKDVLSAAPGSSRFYSTNPGAFVTVDVTPERRMVATVPIDFEAAQYNVQMKARTSGGQTAFVLNSAPNGVPLRPIVVERQLAPGSYVFDVVITGGDTEKIYTVNFIVK